MRAVTDTRLAGHEPDGSFVRSVLHVPARRVTGRPSGLGTTGWPGRCLSESACDDVLKDVRREAVWGMEPRLVGRPTGEGGRSTAPLAGSSAWANSPASSSSNRAASGRRRGCRLTKRPPSTVGPSDESWLRARARRIGHGDDQSVGSARPLRAGTHPRVVPQNVEAGRFVPVTDRRLAGHDAHGPFVRSVLHVPARRVTGRPSGPATTGGPGRWLSESAYDDGVGRGATTRRPPDQRGRPVNRTSGGGGLAGFGPGRARVSSRRPLRPADAAVTDTRLAGRDAHGSFVRSVLNVTARRVTGRPSGLGTTGGPGPAARRQRGSADQPHLWRRLRSSASGRDGPACRPEDR